MAMFRGRADSVEPGYTTRPEAFPRLRAPPERLAGFIPVPAPKTPGTYKITLSAEGWIDVEQSGQAVKSGAFSGALSGNAQRISQEKKDGWIRQLRLTSLPPYAYVVSKIIVSMATTVTSIVIVLLLALLYPVQMWRVYRGARRRGVAPRHAAYYGVACVVAKFPQFLGLCRFYARRLFRRPARIIEHKPAVSVRG